jgi:hypothetical protein
MSLIKQFQPGFADIIIANDFQAFVREIERQEQAKKENEVWTIRVFI